MRYRPTAPTTQKCILQLKSHVNNVYIRYTHIVHEIARNGRLFCWRTIYETIVINNNVCFWVKQTNCTHISWLDKARPPFVSTDWRKNNARARFLHHTMQKILRLMVGWMHYAFAGEMWVMFSVQLQWSQWAVAKQCENAAGPYALSALEPND